jgi:hypothetical protein
MKIIIAGSRDIKDPGVLAAAMDACKWFTDLPYNEIEIVEGGAPGIDALAKKWAKAHKKDGVRHKAFPADWTRWGQSAGPLRNRDMARYADALIAIPKHPKPTPRSGTWNMISQAQAQSEAGRDLLIFIYHPED